MKMCASCRTCALLREDKDDVIGGWHCAPEGVAHRIYSFELDTKVCSHYIANNCWSCQYSTRAHSCHEHGFYCKAWRHTVPVDYVSMQQELKRCPFYNCQHLRLKRIQIKIYRLISHLSLRLWRCHIKLEKYLDKKPALSMEATEEFYNLAHTHE